MRKATVPNDVLDSMRGELKHLEDKLNEMTKGEFYGPYASRGLETYKVKEIQRLLLRYPDIKDVLRECITKHKEFYEKLLGLPLTDEKLERDESVQKILSLLRNFGLKFSLAEFVKRATQ